MKTAQGETVIREIDGKQYWVTPGLAGGVWRVTNPRRVSHYVVVGRSDDGRLTRPESCSCPDFHHRRRPCKHMAEVGRMIDEADVETGNVSRLEAPSKPTLFRFAQLASGRVRVERWDGGARTECYVLPHDVAASRHRHLYRIGYRAFGHLSRNGRN